MPFPIVNGDVCVHLGDSLALHWGRYVEGYVAARQISAKMRTIGVGGNKVADGVARFDADAAPWAPTMVSFEFGMNDAAAGRTPAQYTTDIQALLAKVSGLSSPACRPLAISTTALTNGDTAARLTGVNLKLDGYAQALVALAIDPTADQFRDVCDIFGGTSPLVFGGMTDLIHPQQAGHLISAAVILQKLGADGFVSSLSIDWNGTVNDTDQCTVSAITTGAILKFDRLDQYIPLPIDLTSCPSVGVYPAILDLSQHVLTVTGLASGNYRIVVDTKDLGVATDVELAAGVNLSRFCTGPYVTQGYNVTNLINQRGTLVTQWKAASAANKPGFVTQIEAKDAAIAAAAAPVNRHYQILAA